MTTGLQKLRTVFLISTIIIGSTVALSLTTCNKNKPDCFDRKLYRQHKNDGCTDDCPGVTGCDGKFYCNECEANRQGIRVK